MPESRIAGNSPSSSLPLIEVTVVECGQGVAAAFAAKMLAMLGAGVIKVEPPGGDITRRRGRFPTELPIPNGADCSCI